MLRSMEGKQRTWWERALCRCRMHNMPLHIALVHVLSLFLTTYGENSQGKMTSNHLQTLPWLNRPGKYLQLKCCGTVSCRLQFSCFPFFLDTSSLLVCKRELYHRLQAREDLAWLSGSWEISSIHRDGTEGPNSAPAWLQESPCHLCNAQIPISLGWELEAATSKYKFERDIYKVLKLFWGQTLSVCSG